MAEWRFSLMGLECVLRIGRDKPRHVAVWLPPSSLLDTLRAHPKSDDADSARSGLARYADTPFWEHDEGYAFAREALTEDLQPGRAVLDIGCAYGQLPWYLKHLGLWRHIEYHGTDVAAHTVAQASQAHPSGRFVTMDAQSGLPARNGGFDVVWSKGTLCSALHPSALLDQLLALRAERVFLIHTALSTCALPDDPFITTLIAGRASAYAFTIMDERRFEARLEQAGYQITAWRRRPARHHVINHAPYRLHDLILTRR